MKRLVRFAIENTPAMNMLMIAVLVLGTLSLAMMRREVFPRFELEIVLVTVPYPGASPAEVERGICQKIEEAVQSIDGVKKLYSVSAEGSGSVIMELRADIRDVQRVVNEVRSEVERIPSFPELAEDPEVQQVTLREAAIRVAVMAPIDTVEVDEWELRAVTEQVRDELLQLDSVSQVQILGARDYQIDIEIDETTLRKHGLSLEQVAQIVRRENLEIPGGTMRGEGQEILLRGENKRLVGQQIAELPLLTDPGGVVLKVGDLAHVRDGFTDMTSVQEVNGRPAMVLSVERTMSEDLLAMTAEVRDYVAARTLSGGYQMLPWSDRSVDVRDRLDMLIENGLIGLLLVFLVLATFLELRLAFWVALGIPVALLGAGAALLLGDQTLNMLSMFAFLMALGIVVDDAIVVGENIYAHQERGKPLVQAAIDGTAEVMPSVLASVVTTIIAFCPMFFVSGVMGKFIAVMPFAVIAMLGISLLESQFVLPCHLAHRDNLVFRLISFFFYPLRFVVTFFERLNRSAGRALQFAIERMYLPSLRFALVNRWLMTAGSVALLMCAVGFIRSGIVPFVVFPKLDSTLIQGTVTFPDGTPAAITEAATRRLVDALQRVNDKLSPAAEEPLCEVVFLSVGRGGDGAFGEAAPTGSQIGNVDVELVDPADREVTSQMVTAMWREEVGAISGVDTLKFGEVSMGPGGTPIEFKMLAPVEQVQDLEAAVEICKQKLATYPGVFDIEDNSRPGKWEYRIRVKEKAHSLGVSTADIANTIRAAYYGAEVMRLQRGRHEVKLMVRYPVEERRSLADFHDIYIRTADGQERPLTELAEINVVRGYSEINRLEQKRSITVRADVDEAQGNARQIVQALQADVMPDVLQQFPGLQVRWEGQQEQTQESVQSLLIASLAALLIMFVLLTLEFKAYVQPVMIMAIIPFGLIGAVLGHAIMGLPLTLFSFFGLVALTGVVVNDSIVLVDFINHRVRKGIPIDEALLDAGKRRFRPVLLTSATTIAGLAPILMESSFQAQVLIPMATSLSFGLMLSTLLVLMQVPVFYRIYFDLIASGKIYVPAADSDEPSSVSPVETASV